MAEDLWWVPHDTEIWILGEKISGQLPNSCCNFRIELNGDEKTVALPLERCHKAIDDIRKKQPEDLVLLSDVNEATILSCAKQRFQNRKIYTSLGMVMMTLNPFEYIPELYGDHKIKQYENINAKGLEAHVYMVPSRAYNSLRETGANQSILISGESGAGKTEATKQCLGFLAKVASVPQSDGTSMGERIIAASPVLEAFGNAQTIRNPNSSRFGKWMVMNFDEKNRICGSTIISYLLEKSRVTKRDPKERNYHVFYQILRGIDEQVLKKWSMSPNVSSYRYLLASDTEAPPDFEDAKHFQEMSKSFLDLGFTAEETTHIYEIVGAILMLGNVIFIASPDGESSKILNADIVNKVAGMLSVDATILQYGFVSRTLETGRNKSIVTINMNPQKASETRDSLVRALYDKLFVDIIDLINSKSGSSKELNDQRYIGLLDIFGFEIFVENSFEQLCINYCNEILQDHFNYVIFAFEKALYVSENVVCDTISFKDNASIIEEIETGLKNLDEEGRIPKGSSVTWYDKMKRGPKLKNITFPAKKKTGCFVITHYAGNVEYMCQEFMEKNLESLSNDVIGAMMGSSDPVIRRLFASPASEEDSNGTDKDKESKAPTPRAARKNTTAANKSIAFRFKHQLQNLMKMLRTTSSHFIRCIKSNTECKPQYFETPLVHKQLLYSGVFEVVKIQQSGFPCRTPHAEFMDRYICMVRPAIVKYSMTMPSEIIAFLRKDGLTLPTIQMGVTMTFSKGEEYRVLEASREERLCESTLKLQAWLRKILYSHIYALILSPYRLFVKHFVENNLVEAPASLASSNVQMDYLARMKGYDVLHHMKDKMDSDVKLLADRVTLLEESRVKLDSQSEEDVLSLNGILMRAIELQMTTNETIIECKNKVHRYYKAIEFKAIVTADASSVSDIRDLSTQNIADGIASLEEFAQIIPSAIESISAAQLHNEKVNHELEKVLKPMEEALQQAVFVLDIKSSQLKPEKDHDGAYFAVLRSITAKYRNQQFTCEDIHLVYADCVNFVTIFEEFVPHYDAIGLRDFLDNIKPFTSVLTEQIPVFLEWAELQQCSVKMHDALKLGAIPRTQNGSEGEVSVHGIEQVLEILRPVEFPSPSIYIVRTVGLWMLKLRNAFTAADFNELESIATNADRDGIQNNVFYEYPECVDELRNAEWQIIYHGLNCDVSHVLQRPVFRRLTIQSETWDALAEELVDNWGLVDAIKSFSSEDTSPKLSAVLPMFELLLELRWAMSTKDTTKSTSLLEQLQKGSYSSILEEHGISGEDLEQELQICALLIKKIQNTGNLMNTLETACSKLCPYRYEGRNDQPTFATICNLAELVDQLKSANDVLTDMGGQFDTKLQQIHIVTKIIQGGFQALAGKGNEVDSLDWWTPFREYEKLSSSYLTRAKIDINASSEATSYFLITHNFMVNEFLRRIVLTDLLSVLKQKCCAKDLSSADEDLKVDQTLLLQSVHKFNTLSRVVGTELDQYPNNIQTLYSFTANVLIIRRLVLDGNYGADGSLAEAEAKEATIKSMYIKLLAMDHGSGISVSGLKEELEVIELERQKKVAIYSLSRELEIKTLTISFEGEEDETTDERPEVDLTSMREALAVTKRFTGKTVQGLSALGDKVLNLLDAVVSDQSNIVRQDRIKEILSDYEKFSIDNTSIVQVFKYVLNRNFLKFLYGVLQSSGDKYDRIFQDLNEFVASLGKFPAKFLPWLKAAYMYSDLVRSMSNEDDWLSIVDSTKKIGEIADSLYNDHMNRSGGNKRHAKGFLKLLHDKKVEGFQYAIRRKQMAEGGGLNDTSNKSTADTSGTEEKRLFLMQQDRLSSFSISNYRDTGYSDEEVVDIGFPLNHLWAYSFDAMLLREKGYKAGDLLQVGYTVNSLYAAGFALQKLKAAGCSLVELIRSGASTEQLILAGFKPDAIAESTFKAKSKVGRFDITVSMKEMGVEDIAMNELTALELRSAGYSAAELRSMGLHEVHELYDAGFNLHQLKAAGYTVVDLNSAGFSYEELKNVGFGDQCLLDADFGEVLERDVLLDFFKESHGTNWKIRLNWLSDKPVGEWYGVQVSKDSRDRTFVYGLDLSNNNLRGHVTERLWLLQGLRHLQLGHNSFSVPHIPAGVVDRVVTRNKGAIDLSPHSRLDGMHAQDSDARPPLHVLKPVLMQQPPKFGPSNERAALMEIFNSTSGKQWVKATHWGQQTPLEQWFGITVNSSGLVTKLNLQGNGLSGSIPESIGLLRGLVELNLASNNIYGHLPASIGKLARLKCLYLNNNKITGALTPHIAKCQDLVVLDLRNNELTGNIPNEMERLGKLKIFAVRSNKLALGSRDISELLPFCKNIL